MDDYSLDPFYITPSRISLPSTTRRHSLSTQLFEPNRPAKKKLAWISLQGRLVGTEEATSASNVGKGLRVEEAVAWELFSPMERVLAVAVVGVAEKEGRMGKEIAKLERSVKIRDEVLQNMQKKLEDLCEQMNSSNEKPNRLLRTSSYESDGFKKCLFSEKETGVCVCRHSLPRLNPENDIPPLSEILSKWPKEAETETNKLEIFKTGIPMGEPEERRMSDLSDFSTVTSSVDLHLSTLAEEQEFYNLRKESEEKDAIIKELTANAHASSIAESKRISELEEIIRRKKMIITKLKKGMVVLEQKVIQLTREKRKHSISLVVENKTPPPLIPNILYDMSSSSPSSSDSDTPVQQKEHQSKNIIKIQSQSLKPMKNRCISPVKTNHGISRPKRVVAPSSVETKITRGHGQHESKVAASQKRWV